MDESQTLVLIKIITAVYLNSKTDPVDKNVLDELKSYLEVIKTNKRSTMGYGSDDLVIKELRDTAEWMVIDYNTVFNADTLVHRLTMNCQGNFDYITVIKESITDNVNADEAKQRVFAIIRELSYIKKKATVRQIISSANSKINYGDEYVEIGKFVNDTINALTEVHSESGDEVKGKIGSVDFNDPESVSKVLEQSIIKISSEGCLKTGLIGLDKGCGGYGISRGEMVNFGGLTHNYKSGILLDLTLNIPTVNIPVLTDPTKIPLIIRISFENTTDLDIKEIYQRAYERETGLKCNLEKIVFSEASKWLTEHIQKNGYKVEILHYDPDQFTVYDLFRILNDYIAIGYEIHAVIIDYLELIAKNTFGDRLDTKIQRTFEMVRNFCHPKNIACITAHQLSTQAQEEAKINPHGLAEKCSSGGWYKDCKSMHQKLDLEYIMHIIEHVDGFSYLNFARGKHRYHSDTPKKYKRFYYKFDTIGGIGSDYNKESKALYALPKAVGEGVANMDWN